MALPETEAATSAEVCRALDGLRIAITVHDSGERLTYANQHFNYLFRSLPHRDALIGLGYDELIRLEIAGGEIAESELERGEAAFVAKRRRQFQERSFQPLDVKLADGRIVEIKARASGMGGWIALWTDVTAARHATMRLEDTIELSADAFAFWDRRDRLILCNSEFAALHGANDPAHLMGQPFADLMTRAVARERFEIDDDVESWLSRRMDSHRAAAGAFTCVTKNGSAYLVRERATRGGGSVTVFTDATDRHRVEKSLERTQKALAKTKDAAKKQASYLSDLLKRLSEVEAEADTAKTTLLRTMSHELKTPLNAILGFADLLRACADRFGPDQVSEYAGLIRAGGENLLKLINQILDLTKLAAGRYPLCRAPVEPRFVLTKAMDCVSARAAAKSVSLILEADVDCSMVDADECALSAALMQLVENAVAFTQAGGEVRLTAWRADGRLHLRVADNGPGVPQDDLARILEPFEQVGRGTADHASGAGLGLPLAKGLVELHGGTLAIESVLGDGFTATVAIPT